MNKDTRLTDVLHILLHLDRAAGPVTSDALAQTMRTNPAVFRRTLAGLRNAGYVQSGKGPGGGWKLATSLDRITLLDVYAALGRPNLFGIGSRTRHPECLIERNVNNALADTMAQAEAIFIERFKSISLDMLAPEANPPGQKNREGRS